MYNIFPLIYSFFLAKILVLIPELLDTNLKKLELYYNNLVINNSDNSYIDDSLIKFRKSSYYGVEIESVIYDNKNYTSDNFLRCSLQTRKIIDRIRIENFTRLSNMRDTILAYDLESRTCDVVTDYIIDKKKVSAFKRKK